MLIVTIFTVAAEPSVAACLPCSALPQLSFRAGPHPSAGLRGSLYKALQLAIYVRVLCKLPAAAWATLYVNSYSKEMSTQARQELVFHVVDKSCLPFLACLTIEHSVREGQTYRTSEQALHLCIGTYGHPARLQNNNQREVRCCVTQAAHTHATTHYYLTSGYWRKSVNTC